MRTHALLLAVPLLVVTGLGVAQDAGFELAFCAPPSSYPMADRELGGYDVEIAELLAEELGATATFTWTRFDDVGIRDTLHAGLCDVTIGVTEGAAGLLTTVPYLNAAYAFVTRAEDGLEVASLDDPQLRELRIGTYQGAVPSVALRNRGIVSNVKEYAALIRPTGVDPHTPVLDGLVAGEVDVAIVYGPYAAARAASEQVELDVRPMTPEVDLGPSLLPLTRILAIGVRSRDEALRDALNRALARRWDDVAAVLDRYGVPRFPVPRPVDSRELAGLTKVGVVFPASTPAALPNGPVGDDARRAVQVAENALAHLFDAEAFAVLEAHAPTVEAAVRAARRLVAHDGVKALVGGYDDAEARALAEVASELDVPFFDVASTGDALRSRCYPTTFHVAPSRSMSVAAAVAALEPGAGSVFVVVEDGDAADELGDLVRETTAATGLDVAGFAIVGPGQFVYFPLLQGVAASGARQVLLVMSADSQEAVLSQAGGLLAGATFVGVNPLSGQTRHYLERLRQVAPGGDPGRRIVVWDPAVPSDLNVTYASRTGEPMEPAAWTTYAAIVIALEAAQAGALDGVEELRSFLAERGPALELGKRSPVSFRTDGQMVQELYVVEADPDARWGRTATDRVRVGVVTQVVPPSVTEDVTLPAPASCGAP